MLHTTITTHSSERTRAGIPLLIRKSIFHFHQKGIREPHIQSTIITTKTSYRWRLYCQAYCLRFKIQLQVKRKNSQVSLMNQNLNFTHYVPRQTDLRKTIIFMN